jgi:hypothetical protein
MDELGKILLQRFFDQNDGTLNYVTEAIAELKSKVCTLEEQMAQMNVQKRIGFEIPLKDIEEVLDGNELSNKRNR